MEATDQGYLGSDIFTYESRTDITAATRDITAATRLVALLGHPVGHSLSPRLHNAAFKGQGLNMVYLAFDVEPAELPAAVAGLRALGVVGANITVPYKETILPLLDRVDPVAGRIGAVNTVVNQGGMLIGHNTDIAGFRETLRRLLPGGAAGHTCLVVGAGGAARAVLAALIEEGAATVLVCNRTLERAVHLCQAAGTWGQTHCQVLPVGEIEEGVHRADILVNATPVGLPGMVKNFTIPVDRLDSRHVLVDLVYGEEITSLVQAAQARGARAVDGRIMLVLQAACSYQLWTGCKPPVEVMWKYVQHE